MTDPAEPEQRNYKITDDLSTAKLRDWIEGVGFINTHYELQFVHKFAEAILQQPQELTVGMVCAFESGQKDERIKWEKKIADAIKELEERRGKISARNDETPQYLTQGNVNEAMMLAFDIAIALLRENQP